MWKLALAAVVLLTTTGCRSKPVRDGDAGAPATPPAPAPAAATAPPAPAPPPPPPPARPARVEHTVWKLVDNRHAVHRYVGGELVIDAADVGMSRYARFGVPVSRWHYGHTAGGERAAVADRIASIEVPLADEQTRSITRLIMRVHGADDQTVTLKVNGRKAGKGARIALTEGWQTIAFPIEPGRLAIGENQLVLETGGARGRIAVAWLRLGEADDPADPRPAAVFDARQDTIRLARDATLIWYITVPDGAHLVAETGTEAEPGAGGCVVEVQARSSDDSVAGGLLGEGMSRVDLTTMTGKVVGLSLTATDCPVATIRSPRITLHGAPRSVPAAGAPPRYVVLWVMDALRADKVPMFTPGARAQTPNLDELAKTSVVFRQFYVQGNESQTSHSSVWTSLYPAVHNVRLAGVGGSWRIEPRHDVLAQRLADAGLFTTGLTGNGFVSEDGGYARGFAEYRNMMRETGVINGIIYGEKIVDAALARLDAHRDQPTYLFMGTIDTHGPWIARRPWIDIYSPGPYDGPFKEFGTAKELGFRPGSMGCSIIPPKPDIERLRAIYDSAISYQDVQVGRFVKQLTSWGIWDQTMLVITADHGEELFEDRRCGHGGSLRDSLIRVPLLVHYPARMPAAIVDEGVEGVDIMPTMLDALGAPPVDDAQGASLVPLAHGVGRGWPRPSYASMYEYAHAMRIGRWKIRVGVNGVPIVGDLVADPGETQDVSGFRLVERRMLTDNLGLFLALRKQWNKRAWGVTTGITAEGAAALDGARTP